MKTTAAELALYATIGSLWADLAVAYRYLSRDHRLPALYRTKAFYLVRGSIALAAAVLPRVFGIDTIYSAFSLGVVAPFSISRIPCTIAAFLDKHHDASEESAESRPRGADRCVAKARASRTRRCKSAGRTRLPGRRPNSRV